MCLFSEGIDYHAVDEEVVFGFDEDSKSVLIPFTDDDGVLEPNKTFEVYLSASPGVFISPIAYVTATILNDDILLPGLCCGVHVYIYIYNEYTCIYIYIYVYKNRAHYIAMVVVEEEKKSGINKKYLNSTNNLNRIPACAQP